MKKIIGKIGSWSTYYLGDFISKFMYKKWFTWVYIPYSFLMRKSSDIQDWANLDQPWIRVDHSLVTLFRPVGMGELILINSENFTKFPSRLISQPFFYPVLDRDSAIQIAKHWNTNDEFSGYFGAVLEFQIPKYYFDKFEQHNVGGKNHNELWIPSEQLEEFNDNIKSKIKILDLYYGEKFNENRELKQILESTKI